MEQEKIFSLILSKLDSIEKEQQEIKIEQQDMKKEIFMKLDKVEVRLDKLEKGQEKLQNGQESMKEYMLNSEIAFEKFEQDHKFIEKSKKVAGE